MSQFSTILMSAIVGLFAGMGHGVVSHHADLPVSLIEQATDLFNPEPQSKFF